MIWDSVAIMTITDLAIVGAVAWAWMAWLRREAPSVAGDGLRAPLLVLSGLTCVALLYVTDLFAMHGLPRLVDQATAQDVMMRLHLDASWLVTFAAVGLIGLGLLFYDGSYRRSMAALRESELRYRSIVGDLSEFIVRWQPGGIRTWVNDRYCELFQASRDELIGTSFFPVIAASDRARITAELEKLTPDAPTRTGTHKVTLPNGATSWQEWTDRALFDESGHLIEVQSVGRDVTDRVLTEMALLESESRFRGLVENTSDWVWEMDARGHHTYSNRKVEELLGYSPAELQGLHWHALMAPEELGDLNARMSECVRDRKGWRHWIVRMRHRDGSYRFFDSSAIPVLDDNGQLVGYRGIDREATFETLMTRISSSLVGCPMPELEVRIERALGEIGVAYGLDRISLWRLDGPYANRTHEWATDGNSGRRQRFRPAEDVPWMAARLERGLPLKLERLDDLPEGAADRHFLEAQGVKSTMVLPLLVEDQLYGAAVFSAAAGEKRWTEDVEVPVGHLAQKIFAAHAQAVVTRRILKRDRDLLQSETLAHVGSFSYYPHTDNPEFPKDWQAEFSQEQCALLELEPDQVSFEAFMERVHPDDRQLIHDAVDEVFAGGRSEIELQYRVLTPSGKLRYFASRTRIDRDESGDSLRIIGANRDITEQVLREESLQSALAEIADLRDQLERENIDLRQEVRTIKGFEQIVGDSEPLRNCLNLVAQAAPTDAAMLLLGETGTGKELVASAIHELSARRDKRMVSINCAALPAELVESELFGHERGAFTGAHRTRQGRFEAANGGTLFLDEIGDLPIQLQGKLLRVLQLGTFERVGGSRTIEVDVRLITATNRDLEQAVEQRTFRSDLYYRINTVTVELPPLRERREDIPTLAHHFATKHAQRLNKHIETISVELLRYLQERDWPGNVRELESFIERLLIASTGPVLTLRDRSAYDGANGRQARGNTSVANLASVEKGHILRVLAETSWKIGGQDGAASRLGLPPSTLRSRMKKLGIDRRSNGGNGRV